MKYELLLINFFWAIAVVFVSFNVSKCSDQDKPGVHAIERLIRCEEQLSECGKAP